MQVSVEARLELLELKKITESFQVVISFFALEPVTKLYGQAEGVLRECLRVVFSEVPKSFAVNIRHHSVGCQQRCFQSRVVLALLH